MSFNQLIRDGRMPIPGRDVKRRLSMHVLVVDEGLRCCGSERERGTTAGPAGTVHEEIATTIDRVTSDPSPSSYKTSSAEQELEQELFLQTKSVSKS